MRNLKLSVFLFSAVFLCMTESATADEDSAREQKALVIIADFADRVCVVAPLETTKVQTSLSASLKAEFDNLLKRLIGLELNAAAKVEKSNSRGVLQEDLAKALADANQCKLKVCSDLYDKLLPKDEKGCRHPDNGLEFWGHTESWNANSGWRRGGSSPIQYCGAEKLAREKKYPGRTVALLDTNEKHKTEYDPFKRDYYRYTCTFEDRWQPIYKFKDTPACNR
jgi:hypothetical protein